MCHSGITFRQLESLMSTLEIQGLSFNGIKNIERELHPLITGFAEETCNRSLDEEAMSTRLDNKI